MRERAIETLGQEGANESRREQRKKEGIKVKEGDTTKESEEHVLKSAAEQHTSGARLGCFPPSIIISWVSQVLKEASYYSQVIPTDRVGGECTERHLMPDWGLTSWDRHLWRWRQIPRQTQNEFKDIQ